MCGSLAILALDVNFDHLTLEFESICTATCKYLRTNIIKLHLVALRFICLHSLHARKTIPYGQYIIILGIHFLRFTKFHLPHKKFLDRCFYFHFHYFLKINFTVILTNGHVHSFVQNTACIYLCYFYKFFI